MSNVTVDCPMKRQKALSDATREKFEAGHSTHAHGRQPSPRLRSLKPILTMLSRRPFFAKTSESCFNQWIVLSVNLKQSARVSATFQTVGARFRRASSLQYMSPSWPEVVRLTGNNSQFFRRLDPSGQAHTLGCLGCSSLDSPKTGKSLELFFSLNDNRWNMVIDLILAAVTPSTDDA